MPPLADWRPPDSWKGGWATLHFECQQDGCEVWRHDHIDSRGNLVGRHYDYPDWYHLDEDERPTTEDYRLLMAKKQVELDRVSRPKTRRVA